LIGRIEFLLAILVPMVLEGARGVWVNVFGVASWFALVEQAKAEEASLECRFGKIYTDYMKRTGRFLPKLHTQLKNN
jgi:protein-S-isoprenylcysteine O-methyltransferase Ste14